MGKQLVYDLPLRIFHWLFAGLFFTAFLIAKNVDSETVTFTYHMLAGFLLGYVVILRLIWGFMGTHYSRLSSFALNPQDLFGYFTGMLTGDKRKWAGHNPASSWAALLMMLLAIGLGITGYLMAQGQGETFEDIHELMANGFLVVVILHIAGVILHSLRHRDGIAFSMVHGSKSELPGNQAIASSKPLVAIVFMILVAAFAFYLSTNYDPQKQSLNLFGTQLQLGDAEGDEEGQKNDANLEEADGSEDSTEDSDD